MPFTDFSISCFCEIPRIYMFVIAAIPTASSPGLRNLILRSIRRVTIRYVHVLP